MRYSLCVTLHHTCAGPAVCDGQVSLDGSYRHWNDHSQKVNVLCAVKMSVRGESIENSKRLINLKRLSSDGVRCNLSTQAAEPLGARLMCFGLLHDDFWVGQFAHDQDANVSTIVGEYFKGVVECLDQAHI